MTDKATEIDQTLLDQVQSLQALVTCNSLIQFGLYPYEQRLMVQQALGFIQTLHKSVLDEALKHPQANKIPKLVEEKVRLKKEAQKAKKEAKDVKSKKN